MRLVRYEDQDSGCRIGILGQNEINVIEIRAAGEHAGIIFPKTVSALLGSVSWQEKLAIARDMAEEDPERWTRPVDGVDLRAPIGSPEKIMCVGLTYQEHIDEAEDDPTENPVLFSKYASAMSALMNLSSGVLNSPRKSTMKWN